MKCRCCGLIWLCLFVLLPRAAANARHGKATHSWATRIVMTQQRQRQRPPLFLVTTRNILGEPHPHDSLCIDARHWLIHGNDKRKEEHNNASWWVPRGGGGGGSGSVVTISLRFLAKHPLLILRELKTKKQTFTKKTIPAGMQTPLTFLLLLLAETHTQSC